MTVWALRFFASFILLLAVLAAVYDGTRSNDQGRLVMTSMGEHWGKIAPVSYRNSRNYVQRTTHPLVWDGAIAPVLALPTWAVLGTLGLVLAYVSRRRRRVNVFAN